MPTENPVNINISPKSDQLLNQLMAENPDLEEILRQSSTTNEFLKNMRLFLQTYMDSHPDTLGYYNNSAPNQQDFEKLAWSDYAAIRLMNYVDKTDPQNGDCILKGGIVENNPLKVMWLAAKHGTGNDQQTILKDMIELFRQFSSRNKWKIPSENKVRGSIDQHLTGLDPKIIELRLKNRDRILKKIIDKITQGVVRNSKYVFEAGLTESEKMKKALVWWNDRNFHLKFAVRSPEELNEMLDNSLAEKTILFLQQAGQKGFPTFIKPYYLSLINVNEPEFAIRADATLRTYVSALNLSRS